MQWSVMHRPQQHIIEGDESPDLPAPKPAATLVVFDEAAAGAGPEQRAPQLLMVKRAMTMQFAGGATVWPGGRVDPDDHVLAAQLAPALDPDDGAGRVAAVRETLEETGLLVGADSHGGDPAMAAALRAAVQAHEPFSQVLAAQGVTLDLGVLLPFARWIPKMNSHRRFDTRFYITRRPADSVPLSIDESENSALFWASARDSLAMADAGEIAVIFPTRRNLERIAQYADFAAARDCALRHPQDIISPWIEHRGDHRFLVIPEGLGYPITAEKLDMAMRG
jgi:8-oxo-dGTP pyrophosphatase MutT (NUDIX family)